MSLPFILIILPIRLWFLCFGSNYGKTIWNSDGQQSHQYKKDKRSPLILTKGIPRKLHVIHLKLEIQVLAWDRYSYVAGLDWLIGYQSSPLDSWISNDNTSINKFLQKTSNYKIHVCFVLVVHKISSWILKCKYVLYEYKNTNIWFRNNKIPRVAQWVRSINPILVNLEVAHSNSVCCLTFCN